MTITQDLHAMADRICLVAMNNDMGSFAFHELMKVTASIRDLAERYEGCVALKPHTYEITREGGGKYYGADLRNVDTDAEESEAFGTSDDEALANLQTTLDERR